MTHWYYARNNKKVGPVSSAQLRQLAASGQLTPSDMVLREGHQKWVRAGVIKGLFPDAAASHDPKPLAVPSVPRPERSPPLGSSPTPKTPARSPAEVSKRPVPDSSAAAAASDNNDAPDVRRLRRDRGRTPLLVGLGAGALLLLGVSVLAALWATGFFSKAPKEEPALAQGQPTKPVHPKPENEKPEPEPTGQSKTEPKPAPGKPEASKENAPAAAQPETGPWLGVIEGGEFSPMLVEFQVQEGKTKVEALFLNSSNLSKGWSAAFFSFDEQKVSFANGQLTAADGESKVTLTFVNSNEARGHAKVRMEIFKKPGLEMVKTLVTGDFTAKPRRLWGGVLGGGPNPLLDSWHCLTRSFDTMRLEFKADGTGSVGYKTHGKSFTYLFDPKSRRVDISDAQGDCELTADGRLSTDLRFSFIDVLASGMPTINVDVKGFFLREKAVARPDPTPQPTPTPKPQPKDGTYVGVFVKTDTKLPAFKVNDKVYYLAWVGVAVQPLDADHEKLAFMTDGKKAVSVAQGEIVVLQVKLQQGMFKAAQQGRTDLLQDKDVPVFLALLKDEKVPNAKKMMLARKYGVADEQLALPLILSLCRHELPEGKFVVKAKEQRDSKDRAVLLIETILPETAAARPDAKEPERSTGGELWAKAEYAQVVFQLTKDHLDKELMAKIDPAHLPKTEGKGAAKITDKFILATAKGLPPSSLLPDGKGGLKITLNILREESNSWPAEAKPLANESMWGSAFVTKPNPAALAYNLLLTGKPDAKSIYRGKASGILANGTKFHAVDFEMSPHRFGD